MKKRGGKTTSRYSTLKNIVSVLGGIAIFLLAVLVLSPSSIFSITGSATTEPEFSIQQQTPFQENLPQQIQLTTPTYIDLSYYFDQKGLTFLITESEGVASLVSQDILYVEPPKTPLDITLIVSDGISVQRIPLTIMAGVVQTPLAAPASKVRIATRNKNGNIHGFFSRDEEGDGTLVVNVTVPRASQLPSSAVFYDLTSFSETLDIFIDSPIESEIHSDIIFVENIAVNQALISLNVYDTVNSIAKCDDFDKELFVCNGKWEPTTIPFERENNLIHFRVNSFSAYAGSSAFLNIPIKNEEIIELQEKVEEKVKEELQTKKKVRVIITFTVEEQATLQLLSKEDQLAFKKQLIKQKIEEIKQKLSQPLFSITGPVIADEEPVAIVQEYETIEAFAAEITLEGLELLEADPSIEGIFIDREFFTQLNESVSGITSDLVHNLTINGTPITGTGQAVCVLDTGIDMNHPAFTGRIIAPKDFVNNDEDPQDDAGNNHGTHVSGIIGSNDTVYKGVAPNVFIVPVKVCNSFGSCLASKILAGIDYCNANARD